MVSVGEVTEIREARVPEFARMLTAETDHIHSSDAAANSWLEPSVGRRS